MEDGSGAEGEIGKVGEAEHGIFPIPMDWRYGSDSRADADQGRKRVEEANQYMRDHCSS